MKDKPAIIYEVQFTDGMWVILRNGKHPSMHRLKFKALICAVICCEAAHEDGNKAQLIVYKRNGQIERRLTYRGKKVKK
jgi:hypothetical protein